MEEIQHEVKPLKVKDKEQMEKYADELLGKWKEYSLLKKRMDTLNSTISTYMKTNNVDVIQVGNGKLFMQKQTRNVLDRSLIDEIEKYYKETEFIMIYKSPKPTGN